MLFFPNHEAFATGGMEYEYHPVAPGDNNFRLLLRINVENVPTLAVIDTGAPFLLIAPTVADRLGFDPGSALEHTNIGIRKQDYQGSLFRVDVELAAAEGESITFQATAFVPDPDQVEKWGNLPTFLGVQSCLERIRFAIDPSDYKFYFGPLP